MPICKIGDHAEKEVVKMFEMKPLQWGTIERGKHNSEVVMRTASKNKFEVFSLTDFSPDACWSDSCPTEVRLGKGKLKLTIEN